MKKAICFILAFILSFGIIAFAVGDSNVDGGGGNLGDGTSEHYWSSGRDGVRITVIRESDGAIMTSPIDFSNQSNNDIQVYFSNVCKLQYLNGVTISTTVGEYTSIVPTNEMPQIISSSGTSNIDEIRQYFCKEGTIRDISSITGFNYDFLINGDYKILVEPIAYFKYNDLMYAMTATEGALYNQMVSNDLRSKMGTLTHKNLPLAMFLETTDLGISAWKGSTLSSQTDQDIIAYLGIGIIRFTELPDISVDDYDVAYRPDTDVITSVTLSTSSEKNPDNPAYATFYIDGQTYTHSNIYIPEDGSQLAWIKWHTPTEPGTITITISSNCTTSTDKIVAEIVSIDENEPPDPQANDRNDGFSVPNVPNTSDVTSLTWGEWDAWWYEYWVDNGQWEYDKWTDDNGEEHKDKYWESDWEDEGWYVFEWTSYSASLSATMNIIPDSMSPTATSTQMKSGYGFNMDVSSNVLSNAPTSHYTGMQSVVAYFPEFEYQTYWRVLDRLNSGYSSSFSFKVNQYSTYGRAVHFVPVWYPNGTYTAYATCIDAWTPAGMMSMNLTDSLNINGSVFDDWHVGAR
ncbi:MAG: hypothetical protein R3Y09_03605 [Clostridia bacterium]